ncbi:Tap42 interacting protein [Tilletia horrida]|nr:Tap42 interacting protein [Tilletia horrida]
MHHFETTRRPAAAAQVSVPAPVPAPAPTATRWQLFERTFPASTSATLDLPPDHAAQQQQQQSQQQQDDTSAPTDTPAVPSVVSRGIDIAGWSITATKGPIANSAQMDTFSSDYAIPPPEMLFPANTLVIAHPASGFSYTYDAVRALSTIYGVAQAKVRTGLDLREPYERSAAASSAKLGSKPKSKGIKVAYAQEWGKSRTELPTAPAPGGPSSADAPAHADGAPVSTPAPAGTQPSSSFFGPGVAQAIAANATADIADARDYDWTYSTTWPGVPNLPSLSPSTASSLSASSVPTFQPATDPTLDRIPIEKLGAGSEPILFYDEVVLFEDELADNGSSMLSVKVRVMPSGFLVLQRFLLRVDGVLFRMFDTRMYASFVPPSPSDSAALASAGAVPQPSASAYAPLGRPTGRPTPIPSLEPGRIGGVSSPSTAASVQQGMSKLSLGPTRRQMREEAAAAAQAQAQAVRAPSASEGGASAPSQAQSSAPPSSANGSSADRSSSSAFASASSAAAAAPSDDDDKPYLRVIRECAGWEATYAEVKSRLPPYKAWDLSPLTDPNWIASTLQSLASTHAPPAHPFAAAAATATATAHPQQQPHVSSSATILGPVEEDKWEGVGARVEVALVPL